MPLKGSKVNGLLKGFFLLAIIFLLVGFVYLFQQINAQSINFNELANTIPSLSISQDGKVERVDVCGEDCKSEIEKSVSEAIATLSGETKTTIVKETVTQTSPKVQQVSYIPLAGPITSTSTDWVDAPGAESYINLAEYGSSAIVTWDASLKVAHGNGKAYARLFDVTHGIAVNGSEFSTTDNSDYLQVSSGNLSFWAGDNIYRVQIKSLNSFEVSFGGGRVKIVY